MTKKTDKETENLNGSDLSMMAAAIFAGRPGGNRDTDVVIPTTS